MKHLQATLTILCLVCVSLSLSAQTKYSTVKVYVPEDKTKRAELIGLLQIDHFYVKDGAIVSQISDYDVEKLKHTGYRYEILVDDVAKSVQKDNEKYFKSLKGGKANNKVAIEQVGGVIDNIIPTPAAFKVWTGSPNLGGYYTFAQMVTAMDNLVAAYPSIVQKFSLGTSVEGRDIWCIKISDNVATDETSEPEVLYMGLQHAREAIGGSSMIFLMQYLCENYAIDSKIKDLVDNREIFIIPCMNPDGWEYNRSINPNGGGGWRKNRKIIAGTSTANYQYGVDLNRNWSVDWANCSAPIVGASSSCGSNTKTSITETYWGSASFSEPETQAVRNFTKTHHLVAMIDQHAYGPYYSLPFGRPSLHHQPDSLTVPQQQFYTAIPALMGTYNGMRAGNSAQSVGYEVAGGVKDWMLKGEIGVGTKGIVYGMTGEGAAGNGTPAFGTYANFWAPANQIIYLCKGMTYQNLQLAYSAGSYVDINDVDDIAVASKTGSFNFQLRRIGLADQAVLVTMIPIENIQSVGSAVPVATLPNYYDTYTGNISYTLPASITNGQRIKFAWKVQTGGYTYYDTVVKFYNPTQILYDDMEGSFATNWTTTFSGTGASGWGLTSAGTGYGGTGKAMSESPSGNYTKSTIRTATYKNSFNLSDATAAYLTFWTRHRAENYRDRLQVQISTDGSTWTPIVGSTTIQENVTFDDETIAGQPSLTGVRDNWTKEIYDLNAFRTNVNVQLRFQFLSDADGSGFDFELDDGFYIDNVKLVKSTTTLLILPVKFVDVSGKITTDNKINVSWKATIDDKFSYFDVEKSTDGRTFKSIGTVNGSSAYNILDANPVAGDNYYRIKGVDMDGQFTYSKVIDVIYNPSAASLTIYPNPVENVLHVKINTKEPGTLTLLITDIDGRIIHRQNTPSAAVNQNIDVNAASWKPQVYIVKVVGQNNEVLAIQKFIKR
jgi:carboxypeptidase T